MSEFLTSSAYFGVILSLSAYAAGTWLRRKLRTPLANPLLISIMLTICTLLILGIEHEDYSRSADILGWLLTPATTALAVPLYEQLSLLKRNLTAVLIGIGAGAISGLVSIYALSMLFGLTREQYVTLLPKSITAAIGIPVAEELGGIPAIAAGVIIITGIFGNITAEFIFKIFRITEPIAKGIALGTSSHAIGTAKATELGTTEGAMSSLAIVVSGLITTMVASVFADLL